MPMHSGILPPTLVIFSYSSSSSCSCSSSSFVILNFIIYRNGQVWCADTRGQCWPQTETRLTDFYQHWRFAGSPFYMIFFFQFAPNLNLSQSSLNKNALNTLVGDKKHKLDAALNSFSSTCPFAGFQTHLQVQTLQLWLTLQRPSAMSQSSVRCNHDQNLSCQDNHNFMSLPKKTLLNWLCMAILSVNDKGLGESRTFFFLNSLNWRYFISNQNRLPKP